MACLKYGKVADGTPGVLIFGDYNTAGEFIFQVLLCCRSHLPCCFSRGNQNHLSGAGGKVFQCLLHGNIGQSCMQCGVYDTVGIA